MNKQTILDFEDFLSSYKDKKINRSNLNYLFPITTKDLIIEEYAYVIGKIMGDGNLDPKFTCRFIGQKEDLILLKKFIIKEFNIEERRFSIKKRVHKGVSYLLQVNCAYFGRILYLLGAPTGNKTTISFKIPNWILNNQNSIRRLLQALLEDELTTIKIEKCNYSVKPMLKMAKREELIEDHKMFMRQVKESIESFGIGCSNLSKPLQNPMTQEIYFSINRNKNNILRFKDEIGFRFNQNKVKKLYECCRIIKNSLK